MKQIKKQKTANNKYMKNGIFFNLRLRFLLFFTYPVFWVVSKLMCRWKIKGKQNLKAAKKSGSVVVINHCHPLDCVIASLAMYPRAARITSMASNLKIRFAGRIIRALGVVPIPVTPAGLKQMLNETITYCQNGGTAIFMPEGHLIKDCSELRKFHNGAFLTAKRAGVPVIPAAYSYTLTRRNKIRYTLNIGKPVDTSALTTEEIKEQAYSVMLAFTQGNRECVKLRYGKNAYSGDPRAEMLMRMMLEQNVSRSRLVLPQKQTAAHSLPQAETESSEALVPAAS